MAQMSQTDEEKYPALSLYKGEVSHWRFDDIRHVLHYSVFYLCLDLGKLKKAGKQSRFFSVNRANLFSFYESDHMESGFADLPTYINSLCQQAGITTKPARITLTTFPRFLGHAFNPISIFCCFDKNDALTAIVYQVNNTFGDRHHYVVETKAKSDMYRHDCAKTFHVSPFMAIEGKYHFTLKPPSDNLSLLIRYTSNDKPKLTARFDGKRLEKVNNWSLLHLAFGQMQSGLKILGAIHYEAAKLWFKGATFHKRPEPPVNPVTTMPKPDIANGSMTAAFSAPQEGEKV